MLEKAGKPEGVIKHPPMMRKRFSVRLCYGKRLMFSFLKFQRNNE